MAPILIIGIGIGVLYLLSKSSGVAPAGGETAAASACVSRAADTLADVAIKAAKALGAASGGKASLTDIDPVFASGAVASCLKSHPGDPDKCRTQVRQAVLGRIQAAFAQRDATSLAEAVALLTAAGDKPTADCLAAEADKQGIHLPAVAPPNLGNLPGMPGGGLSLPGMPDIGSLLGGLLGGFGKQPAPQSAPPDIGGQDPVAACQKTLAASLSKYNGKTADDNLASLKAGKIPSTGAAVSAQQYSELAKFLAQQGDLQASGCAAMLALKSTSVA